jgi:AGZA family xanthine/uracil permease-like MFS transporter
MAQTETASLFAETGLIERVFHLAENQTTISRELLGGLTTFMAMAYVVVVNPRILGEAGMPVEGVLFATCLSAAIATLVMGIWANYPIALAPGMSLNAYFTYSIVLGRGVPWQTALGVVFLSGLLFLVLTLTNIREHIVNDIPDCLKHGTAAGIGFFIAFIGMRNAKIIVANPATFVGIGKIADPQVLLAAFGLILIAILMSRRVVGAILIGIVAIALAGIPLHLATWPSHLFSLPHPGGTFLKLDFRSAAKLGLGELRQGGHGFGEDQRAAGNVFRGGVFVGAVAVAVAAWDEEHHRGRDARHEKRVVIGAADHFEERKAMRRAGFGERFH